MENITSQATVKQHPEYYNGFLGMLQQMSFDKGQAGVQFTPANFETLLGLLHDYKTTEDRRQHLASENENLRRRITDLQAENQDLYRRINNEKYVFPPLPTLPPYVASTVTLPKYSSDGNNIEY